MAMNGRLLPHLLLNPSESHPMSGSVSTSKERAKAVKNDKKESPAPKETVMLKE